MKIFFRIVACVIFLSGLSVAFVPGLKNELMTLVRGGGPRDSEPMDSETWRFSKLDDPALSPYFLYKPSDLRPGEKLPLVVVLHGAPGKAYAAKFLSKPALQRDYKSFILVPTTPWNKHWAMPNGDIAQESLAHVVDTVQKIKKENANIDASRVYIIGCSDGGMAVFAAAYRYADVFAAAIPISGYWDLNDAAKMAKMPMWIMSGSQDNIIPPRYSRDIAAILKIKGGDVTYTEYGGVGHAYPADFYYTRSVWTWLFQKKLNG